MEAMKKLVLGAVLLGGLCAGPGRAEAAFTPRTWLKGGVNVVAGFVKAVDSVAEAAWEVVHGDVLHPLGLWGKSVIDGIVSIGQPSG